METGLQTATHIILSKDSVACWQRSPDSLTGFREGVKGTKGIHPTRPLSECLCRLRKHLCAYVTDHVKANGCHVGGETANVAYNVIISFFLLLRSDRAGEHCIPHYTNIYSACQLDGSLVMETWLYHGPELSSVEGLGAFTLQHLQSSGMPIPVSYLRSTSISRGQLFTAGLKSDLFDQAYIII